MNFLLGITTEALRANIYWLKLGVFRSNSVSLTQNFR